MPGPRHGDQQPSDGIHVVHALEFADEAARLAYVPAPQDVGKVARQLSDGSFWILASASPARWAEVSRAAPRSFRGGATAVFLASGFGPWIALPLSQLVLPEGSWAVVFSGWARFTGSNDRARFSLLQDGVELLESRRELRRGGTQGNVRLSFCASAVVDVTGGSSTIAGAVYPLTGSSSVVVYQRTIWAVEVG